MVASDGDAGAGRAHVALVGLSGTGKSTSAPILASRLGFGCVDIDREIERRHGASVSDLFESLGEPAFRVAESEALADALNSPPSVVATGGGAVLSPANRQLLSERATVVWLQLDVDELVARLSVTNESRPLLAHDPATALQALAVEREPLYREVADLVVDVADRSPTEVADTVATLLGRSVGAPHVVNRAGSS